MGSRDNTLYLAVLPIIHLSSGLTEQVLTLFANREQGTLFLESQLNEFTNFFMSRAKHLTGDVVISYECFGERVDDEYFLVKVIQHVR